MQAIFPTNDPRNTRGGKLSDAMAEDNVGLQPPILKRLGQSHLEREERGLCPRRLVE